MKRFTLIFISVTLSIFLFSQAPQAFKYQTLVRNDQGEVLANQPVNFQISIIEGEIFDPAVYTEIHYATTNQFGLVNLEIGNGSTVLGDFSTIDWANYSHFIEVEIEIDESGYQLMGTSPLLSVPYALYAENAGMTADGDWTLSGNDQYSSVSGNVGIGTTTPLEKLHVAGGDLGMDVQHYYKSGTTRMGCWMNNLGGFFHNMDYNGSWSVLNPGEPSGIFELDTRPNLLGFRVYLDDMGGAPNWFEGGNQALEFTPSFLKFKTAGYTRLFVDNVGNFGVGTTTPTEKFQVSGGNLGLDLQKFCKSGTTRLGSWIYNVGGFFNNLEFNGSFSTLNPGQPTGVFELDTRPGNTGFTVYLDDNGNIPDWLEGGNTVIDFTPSTLKFKTDGYTRMTVDNSGNVGIGTMSPSEKLEVVGTVKATAFIGDGSGLTGITPAPDNDWTIIGDDMWSNNTGVVNIGTDLAYPSGGLGINGPVGAWRNSTSALLTLLDSRTDGWGWNIYCGDKTLGDFSINEYATPGYDTSRVYLARGGNVGIATITPTEKLDVNGTVKATAFVGDGSGLTGISGTSDNDWIIDGVDIYSALSGNVGIGTNNPNEKLEIDQGNILIKGNDSFNNSGEEANLYLGSTHNYIKAEYGYGVKIGTYSVGDAICLQEISGNVGIGNTNPTEKLDVSGTVKATAFIGDGSGLTGVSGTPDNDWIIAGDNMYSGVSGNIGIGTTNPIFKLEVDGAISAFRNNNSGVIKINDKRPSGAAWNLYTGALTQGDFSIHEDAVGNTARLYIKAGGDVGIGTDNPSEKLEIDQGNILIKGDDSFNNAGEEATLYLGTTHNYIKAEYGYGVKIGTYSIGDAICLKEISGNVGIGTTSPNVKLDVIGDNYGTIIHGTNTYNPPNPAYHHYGVIGDAIEIPNYGVGVEGNGGYVGVGGDARITGDGSRYGVYGEAEGGSIVNIGVKGKFVYAGSGCGVYYEGGLAGTGTKSTVVRTEEVPKLVYCQESPENWFEDFGTGIIISGKTVVPIVTDFLQTVTFDEKNPMKVFISPNANIGIWWIEKRQDQFVLYAPDAKDGAAFDYRIVAKRKGFESIRLELFEGAYCDQYLYPDINDVPQKYREEWLRLNSKEK